MVPAKANLLEGHLRQKVVQFENSLARIADTRKHLRDNADLVKSEIRATFGTQLTQLRRREQQLLEALDTVVSVKDGILSDQQDQLHQALGACTQGLEWYETAVEDMKESRLVSIATVEQHINDVLKKLSVIEVKPRENAGLSFDADALAIRKAISSFGHVRTGAASKKSFESLPAQLEDYEDEDAVHSLLHKAVSRSGRNTTTIFVGRPQLSSDPKDWLLREALTGRHAGPLADADQSPVFTKHCANTGANGEKGKEAQVHSWLHHIKNQVEYEPNVFEDFEIVKDHQVKPAVLCDTIKADLSGNVTALFRRYFETVLMSPSSQWLLKSMDKMDFSCAEAPTDCVQIDPRAQDFAMEVDVDDLDSCPSTMTYESSGGAMAAVTANSRLVEETYTKLWREFVQALWSSTDSLWLLPCCSEEAAQPVAAAVTNTRDGGDGRLLQSTILKHGQQIAPELVDRAILDRLKAVSLSDKTLDYDKWLYQCQSPGGGQHGPRDKVFEQWLGWKRLVDRINAMGDRQWLRCPPDPQNPADTTTAITSPDEC